MEDTALEDYKYFTSCDVAPHALKLLREDHVHSWIAGSPDGIIRNSSGASSSIPTGKGDGMLEIKCPHGSHPSKVHPAALLQDYYYPQVKPSDMSIFSLFLSVAGLYPPFAAKKGISIVFVSLVGFS